MQNWVEKYKPKDLSGVIGQDKALKEVLEWFKNWKPGKGLFIYGPPGVGKTLTIELIAKEKNYQLLQLNASDSRNAKQIEYILGDSSRQKSLFHSGKIILIDEVDGLSPQDRGAANAIIKIIKESKFSVVLIANDPWQTKLSSLRNYCKSVKFGNIHTLSIEKKLKEICEKEGIEVKGNVLRNLARWSQGDLRSAILDLQTACGNKKTLENKDLEILGYRERESSIFNVMQVLFHSRNINAGEKAIGEADKTPEEVFWWVENNIPLQFTKKDLPKVYDLLSRADIFLSRVSIQQNWRFRKYMIDIISGLSAFKTESKHGFIPYQPPKRFLELAKTKQKREILNNLCKRIGLKVHASSKIVMREYLPYLKIIINKNKGDKIIKEFEISEDELKIISGINEN